jgi:hypothetical protein
MPKRSIVVTPAPNKRIRKSKGVAFNFVCMIECTS